MGWLANLVFGDPERDDASANGASLPKAVESWQRMSNGEPTPVVPEKVQSNQSSTSSEELPATLVGQHSEVHNVEAEPPEVEIVRLESHLSSDMDHVEVWAHLKNQSDVDVEVARVDCLGSHMLLGRYLKPGETHEVKIFAGDTPENDALHTCMVTYKAVETGKYFETEHLVEYHYEDSEHGKYYVPEDMKLLRPVRKI